MRSNVFQIYRPSAFISMIAYSGLVAGVLDSAAGVPVYKIYFDLNPIEVLQFIASGVFGPSAIGGGAAMAVLGTFFHFLIAYTCAIVFALAYPRIALLRENPTAWGLLFGLGVWLFMNLLVLPLSNVPKSPFDPGLAAIGIVWHMLLVGWPIALITKDFFEGAEQLAY